jgi:capsule assembly protein Wzi
MIKTICMQFKQTLVRLPFALLFKKTYRFLLLFIFALPFIASSQTTFLPQGDKQNIFLERLEIKLGKDSVLNFSKTKPFLRKYVTRRAYEYGHEYGLTLSKTDAYNLNSLYLNNIEFIPAEERDQYKSKKPFLKSFYKTPANLIEVHVKDFDLEVNPVFQYIVSKEKDNDQRLFLNTRGVTLRGSIAKKINFYTYLTDNQERDPSYVQKWIGDRTAVPGEGFYKTFKAAGGVDYFDARGYVTFNVTKYIDVAFGYDKNFIGSGYRSLFLSDFGNSNLFLKLNTRIWKINYQNLFMELANADPNTGDRLVGKKYAAIHHLDMGVTKWLNIGLFEAVIFGRKDHFEFGYLNPVIFYRSAEQQNGSFDNSLAGLDFKANVAHHFQLYGQFMLDDLLVSEVKKNRGYWGNKWGIQVGAKYIDAFGIKNLDLQVEHNRVRPFTYAHDDSVANYTHYNQPMAHPLGANFQEGIFIARYQPLPKWMIQVKAIVYQQGRDSSSVSYGSNIFLPDQLPYRTDYVGYNIGSGWKTNVTYASFLLSYEFRQNLFVELSAVGRKEETKTPPVNSNTSTVVSLGIRWNMHRREFDF